MVERYLRGADRFEQRKRNLADKKARGGRRPRGRERDDGAEDGWDEEDWHDPVRPGHDARRNRRGARPKGARARVASLARTEVELLLDDGVAGRATVAPRVLAEGGLAVGDEVLVDDSSRVTQRLPRRSWLERRAPGHGRGTKLLAVNVDVGLVVVAPRDDGLSLGFIDRSIAALEAGAVAGVIVLTKADLGRASGTLDALVAALEPWRDAGHGVHVVSSVSGEGIDELRAQLTGQVAVAFGHSGVGKSTLVNALDPGAAQVTGAVRDVDGRGRHTTTAGRLIPIAGGGALVDTPGVRELVPVTRDLDALARSIPEFAPLLGQCRFRDCAHGTEPGCALRRAAEDSNAIASAFVRFERLLRSADE